MSVRVFETTFGPWIKGPFVIGGKGREGLVASKRPGEKEAPVELGRNGEAVLGGLGAGAPKAPFQRRYLER